MSLHIFSLLDLGKGENGTHQQQMYWEQRLRLRATAGCNTSAEAGEDKITIGRDTSSLNCTPVKLLFSPRYHLGRRKADTLRGNSSAWEFELELRGG